MTSILILIVSLGIILAGAEVFVNGIEWLGKRLELSEGAVGSVLAAVGTALPETLIPIIAIIFGHGQEGHDIGIGAILGAPLMLSTLAMFVTGISVMIFKHRRKHGKKIVADYTTVSRDLCFFIIIYSIAILTGFIPSSLRLVKIWIGIFIVIAYLWYVTILMKEERVESEYDIPSCYFDRKKARLSLIILQVIVALGIIVIGANMFVNSIKEVASIFMVPAFILAIIITPIATELPEKFNSIIWISREKDTLALGNITGAMVFQSSLIPALGIFLTEWHLTTGAFLSGIIALMSAGLIFYQLRIRKHITAGILMAGGSLYLLFILLVVKGIIS